MPPIESSRSPFPVSPAASPLRADPKKTDSKSALRTPEPGRRPAQEPLDSREAKHVRNRHAESPRALGLDAIRRVLRATDPKTALPSALGELASVAAAFGKEGGPNEVRAVVDALLKAHAGGAINGERLNALLLGYQQALPTAQARNTGRAALQDAVASGSPGLASAAGAKNMPQTLRIAQDVLAASPPSLSDRLARAQHLGAEDEALVSLIDRDGGIAGEQRWQDVAGALVETVLEQSDDSTGTRLQQVMRCALQVSPGPKTQRSDLLAGAFRLLATTFAPALASSDAAASAKAGSVFQQAIDGCLEGARVSTYGADSPRWASEDRDLQPAEFQRILSGTPAALQAALMQKVFNPDELGSGTTPIYDFPVQVPIEPLPES